MARKSTPEASTSPALPMRPRNPGQPRGDISRPAVFALYSPLPPERSPPARRTTVRRGPGGATTESAGIPTDDRNRQHVPEAARAGAEPVVVLAAGHPRHLPRARPAAPAP